VFSVIKYAPDDVVTDLPGFWSRMAHTEQRELHSLPSDLAQRVDSLRPLEVASLHCVAPPLNDVPASHAKLSRAAAFIAAWNARGNLQTGYHLAEEMTGAMVTMHPFRGTRRGLQILADLDAANLGIEVWCWTLRPDPPNIDRYERLRLADRLREISA